jgi:catechol 2,3-dioxygenase-like lactoylglutathione lyase family enzyme
LVRSRRLNRYALEFALMLRARRVSSVALSGVCSLALCLLLQLAASASNSLEQSQRSHISGIDHITIYVSNIETSRQFYSDVLGLTVGCPQYTGPDICYLVRPSDARLLLTSVSNGTTSNPHKSWLAEIGFATDNASRMRSYLLGHGLNPDSLQKGSDGARYFHVRDPDGNSIAFVQRPPSKVGYGLASKQISSRLIHAGFVVKDMAAENRFYVELLGFRLYWYGGFKDDGTDWYELQVPDGPDWIEYMLNIPADADHKELGVQNHFSFGVKDVHAAAAQLRARGLRTFDGPEVGRDGKDSLDAYDPDGTRVEIMEFTPVQKPCCHPYTSEHPRP